MAGSRSNKSAQPSASNKEEKRKRPPLGSGIIEKGRKYIEDYRKRQRKHMEE